MFVTRGELNPQMWSPQTEAGLCDGVSLSDLFCSPCSYSHSSGSDRAQGTALGAVESRAISSALPVVGTSMLLRAQGVWHESLWDVVRPAAWDNTGQMVRNVPP